VPLTKRCWHRGESLTELELPVLGFILFLVEERWGYTPRGICKDVKGKELREKAFVSV
jgi:hypothetical protein